MIEGRKFEETSEVIKILKERTHFCVDMDKINFIDYIMSNDIQKNEKLRNTMSAILTPENSYKSYGVYNEETGRISKMSEEEVRKLCDSYEEFTSFDLMCYKSYGYDLSQGYNLETKTFYLFNNSMYTFYSLYYAYLKCVKGTEIIDYAVTFLKKKLENKYKGCNCNAKTFNNYNFEKEGYSICESEFHTYKLKMLHNQLYDICEISKEREIDLRNIDYMVDNYYNGSDEIYNFFKNKIFSESEKYNLKPMIDLENGFTVIDFEGIDKNCEIIESVINNKNEFFINACGKPLFN